MENTNQSRRIFQGVIFQALLFSGSVLLPEEVGELDMSGLKTPGLCCDPLKAYQENGRKAECVRPFLTVTREASD